MQYAHVYGLYIQVDSGAIPTNPEIDPMPIRAYLATIYPEDATQELNDEIRKPGFKQRTRQHE